jgi:hypothetical protein
LQSFRSLRSFVNADMSGLSCKLFPFFPRSPHLPAPPPAASSSASAAPATAAAAATTAAVATAGRRFPPEPPEPAPSSGVPEAAHLEPPPRMAETLECAQRACLRIADVTVMHSVATSPTASTAMVTGACAVSGSVAAGASVRVAVVVCMAAGGGAGLRARSARGAPPAGGGAASGMLMFGGMCRKDGERDGRAASAQGGECFGGSEVR